MAIETALLFIRDPLTRPKQEADYQDHNKSTPAPAMGRTTRRHYPPAASPFAPVAATARILGIRVRRAGAGSSACDV